MRIQRAVGDDGLEAARGTDGHSFIVTCIHPSYGSQRRVTPSGGRTSKLLLEGLMTPGKNPGIMGFYPIRFELTRCDSASVATKATWTLGMHPVQG